MTSSAGTSGLIFAGSPPSSAMASRIAARSTTAGTPVKSCITTRAGVNAISWLGSLFASQRASASMSAAVTEPLPSVRRRFSSRTLSENGSRATSKRSWSAARRKISRERPPTSRVERAPKLSADMGLLGEGVGGSGGARGARPPARPGDPPRPRRRQLCGAAATIGSSAFLIEL
jgi:hypothetical protein